MTDKSTLLKAFNNMFVEFLDDISRVFPDNEDVRSTKNTILLLKKGNPTAIIKSWHAFVYLKYKDVIDAGDMTFFFDKDYSNDLDHLKNANDIMNAIEKIRTPVRNMSEDNKATVSKYLQQLCKLCEIYMTL
jgi:hypothetical protein